MANMPQKPRSAWTNAPLVGRDNKSKRPPAAPPGMSPNLDYGDIQVKAKALGALSPMGGAPRYRPAGWPPAMPGSPTLTPPSLYGELGGGDGGGEMATGGVDPDTGEPIETTIVPLSDQGPPETQPPPGGEFKQMYLNKLNQPGGMDQETFDNALAQQNTAIQAQTDEATWKMNEAMAARGLVGGGGAFQSGFTGIQQAGMAAKAKALTDLQTKQAEMEQAWQLALTQQLAGLTGQEGQLALAESTKQASDWESYQAYLVDIEKYNKHHIDSPVSPKTWAEWQSGAGGGAGGMAFSYAFTDGSGNAVYFDASGATFMFNEESGDFVPYEPNMAGMNVSPA